MKLLKPCHVSLKTGKTSKGMSEIIVHVMNHEIPVGQLPALGHFL